MRHYHWHHPLTLPTRCLHLECKSHPLHVLASSTVLCQQGNLKLLVSEGLNLESEVSQKELTHFGTWHFSSTTHTIRYENPKRKKIGGVLQKTKQNPLY